MTYLLIVGYLAIGCAYSFGHDMAINQPAMSNDSLIRIAFWPVELAFTAGWYSGEAYSRHEARKQ